MKHLISIRDNIMVLFLLIVFLIKFKSKDVVERFCFLFIVVLIANGIHTHAQYPIGIWVNYHPEKGTPLSYIEFFEEGGKLNARVLKIIDQEINTKCDKCQGKRKNQGLKGMTVIWDLVQSNSTQFKKARILDPGNGKI